MRFGIFLAALFCATAHAQGFDAKLSGHVNRALLYADDGFQSKTFHVDNDNSSTRVRFAGAGQAMPGLKAGMLIELEYQSAPSDLVTFADRDAAPPTLDERYVEAWLEGRLGRVSLGQGDGAGNSAVEIDLSGTTVVHYSLTAAVGGAFAFRNSAGGAGPSFGAVLANQDFESRYDRVRYDTPVFGGFTLGLSHGVKDSRDVVESALRYSGDFGGRGKLAAALAWSKEDAMPGGVDDETVGGSVSWLSPGGISLTFGHTQREITAAREGKFTYFKVGYQSGKHAVAVDYAMGDDQSAAGDEARSMSIGYVFTPIAWAELFALAKQAQLDQPGVSYEDLTMFMAGTRIKF
jgi:predicted porin